MSLNRRHFLQLGLLATAGLGLSAFVMPPRPPIPQKENPLLHKVYTLQKQEMEFANWLYIGFAPRMNDPSRVQVYLSKQGYTGRVHAMFSPEEVAAYPDYLVRRGKAILGKWEQVWSKGAILNFSQPKRFTRYAEKLSRIEERRLKTYAQGLALMREFFPQNVREVKGPDGRTWVEGNFVYPITIHKSAGGMPMDQATPQAKTYYPYSIDERRSEHGEYAKDENGVLNRIGVKDHLFGGFPAFWLDPSGKGVGLHGPIRFSSALEEQGIVKQNFITEPGYHDDIDTLIRFDLIRTHNSAGCFRSEPLEIRHLLPSDPALLKQVPFIVLNDFDRVQGRIIDIQYYVDNHYRKQDAMAWYRKHYITFEERQQYGHDPAMLDQILQARLKLTATFPYLNPNALEFSYEVSTAGTGYTEAEAAPNLMTFFNRAPQN